MVTKIKSWGNSLGLRISKKLAKDLHLKDGSHVNVEIQNGKIIITPKESPDYSLEELLEGMEEHGVMQQYIQKEPVGAEIFWTDKNE